MSAPVEAISQTSERTAVLRSIDAEVRDKTGHEAFPAAVWAALADPTRRALVALDSTNGAACVVYESDSFTPSHQEVALGARPGTALHAIASVVASVTAARGAANELVAWIPGSDPTVIGALTAAGFTIDREQFQMRVALPHTVPVAWPEDVEVRGFVRDHDEDDWLRVNNRAFANHPDQGGWIREVLERRMAEPWFDPDGVVMAWRATELLGFCWTKVHTAPESLGEIFIIGVDPNAQGLGLGRALVLAGLDHLAVARHCPTGILYVAANNEAAVGLYRALGFVISRTDTALILERTSTP